MSSLSTSHKEYVEVEPNTRIYFTPSSYGDGQGFTATVFNITCWSGESCFDNIYEYRIVAEVTAYWDGIRHLSFMTKEQSQLGYFNYPNFNYIKLVLDKLSELEKKYCQETIASEEFIL